MTVGIDYGLDLIRYVYRLHIFLGHIGLGLGCHIYGGTESKVINDLVKCELSKVISARVKCELLTTVGKTDVCFGFYWIC